LDDVEFPGSFDHEWYTTTARIKSIQGGLILGSVRKDLKTLTVGGVTTDQVNSAGSRIYLSNVSDLHEAGQLGRDIQSIRTFGPWLDPNSGVISSSEGTSHALTVDAGNQFVIEAVSATNTSGGPAIVTVMVTDGANAAVIASATVAHTGNDPIPLPYPVPITNKTSLTISSSATVTTSIYYLQSVRA